MKDKGHKLEVVPRTPPFSIGKMMQQKYRCKKCGAEMVTFGPEWPIEKLPNCKK
jgi:hypothetical protein